jgi:hypothetical protein
MRVRLTDRFVKSVPKGRKSPIFMDDEVIGFECSSFAALHESGSGLKRRFAAPQRYVSNWGHSGNVWCMLEKMQLTCSALPARQIKPRPPWWLGHARHHALT